MIPSKRIQVCLDQQQSRTKSKIISLLRKYNASMGFNEDENMFEVDLQVRFDSIVEKERFVQAYLRKLREKGQKGEKGVVRQQAVLEEANFNARVDGISKEDIIRELRNEKEAINQESLRIHHQIVESVSPTPSEASVKDVKISQSKSIRKPSEIQQIPQSEAQSQLNYETLSRKLDDAIDRAFRQIYSQYTSIHPSQQQQSIKIIQTQQLQTSRKQKPIKISPFQQQYSPLATANPASSDRLQLIRQINNQIGSYQQHSLDYQRYDVNEVIVEENPSEIASEDSEVDRKKQEHFRFLEGRFKGPQKPVAKQTLNFDQTKFKQFIMIEKKKIDQLFDTMKKSLFVGPNDRSRGKFSGSRDDVVEFQDAARWRETVSITKGSTVRDQSEMFSKRFYEAFETRIIAENKSLSSSQLVNYFKYLINNAKGLYINFAKQGSFKSSDKKLKM